MSLYFDVVKMPVFPSKLKYVLSVVLWSVKVISSSGDPARPEFVTTLSRPTIVPGGAAAFTSKSRIWSNFKPEI